MNDLVFDLRYLRHAILVAELGSFRQAATFLNLSQATLSRRIQSLEHSLGAPLFWRTRNGTYPTPAGEAFFKDASLGARYLDDAVARVANGRDGGGGRVRLGVMTSLGSGFLLDLLGSYRRRYPQIEVVIQSTSVTEALSSIRVGSLDAAVLMSSREAREFGTLHLWSERELLAVPRDHRVVGRSQVHLEELQEATFLVMANGTGPELSSSLERRLSKVGFRPRILTQGVGREDLLRLVAEGFGVAVVSCSIDPKDHPGVAFIPAGVDAGMIPCNLTWSLANKNPALKRLIEVSGVVSKRQRDTREHWR